MGRNALRATPDFPRSIWVKTTGKQLSPYALQPFLKKGYMGQNHFSEPQTQDQGTWIKITKYKEVRPFLKKGIWVKTMYGTALYKTIWIKTSVGQLCPSLNSLDNGS
jgi:hypothetical protein